MRTVAAVLSGIAVGYAALSYAPGPQQGLVLAQGQLLALVGILFGLLALLAQGDNNR